jgi:hypothetical protein
LMQHHNHFINTSYETLTQNEINSILLKMMLLL